MTKEENIKFREELIKKQFKNSLGYDLNLDDPQTFNEKIQWLKLYNHDPLITKCADKYLAREYIKEKIGEEYLIPLLGVWDKAEDIDFDLLPNQFVLKVNWGWGQNIIVKDKTKLDIEEVRNQLNNWLEPLSNHYYHNFEWGYKNIPSKIICEKYIEQLDGHLEDYRILCFNGKPKYVIVDFDAKNFGVNAKFLRAIYNTKWERMDIKIHHPSYISSVNKPYCLDKMIEISEIISKDFIHVRVDFYVLNNNFFIGEITFSHQNGTGKFTPEEWDYKFGELLVLPKEKKIEYDVLDRDTLIQQAVLLEPISVEYKKLQQLLKERDSIINRKDNIIKEKELAIKERADEIIYINKNKNEEINNMKLNSNWFNFLTLFAISNNEEYVRIILFGIKFTFRVNENIINKVAWWIPVKKWRESFRNKFRPDQTRPDQTRPDLIQICKEYIQIYNNSETKKLQPMLQLKMQHRFFVASIYFL